MIWANFLSYVSYIFCKKIWPTIKHECDMDLFIWKLGNENQMVQLWTNEIHWGLYSTVLDINNVSVTCTYILNTVMLPRGYICHLHQCSMHELIRQFMMGKYINWPNFFMYCALIFWYFDYLFAGFNIYHSNDNL